MSDSFSRRKALTYIVCTIVIVIGIPAGAFAVVAGSNAFITDPGTGHRAHVNSSGQLLANTTGSVVKVGNTVPVTGTVKVATNGSPLPITGQVNVGNLPATQTVNGTVDVGDTVPRHPFFWQCTLTSSGVGQSPTCWIDHDGYTGAVIQTVVLTCEKSNGSSADPSTGAVSIYNWTPAVGQSPYQRIDVPLLPQGFNGAYTFTGELEGPIYDPQSRTSVYAQCDEPYVSGQATVSGYQY